LLEHENKSRPPNLEPMISVVVAVFNGAETLQRCIDRVAEQTYPNRELIVMDGGSTDGTVQIIKANSYKIAYWESKPDRGIYHAWNKALDRARGEWICFLGADDYFATADSLSKMLSRSGPGVDFVFGRAALVDEKDRVLRSYGTMWNWEQMKHYQTIAHSGALHRKSLFERYGKFSENYRIVGDYEFFLRVGAATVASYVDEVVVRAGKGGISRSQLRLAFRENRHIQSAHPEIGFYRAWTNYLIAVSKAVLRRMLCSY
jgi:glycosyltransferase involved in cell wall biosynthesis